MRIGSGFDVALFQRQRFGPACPHPHRLDPEPRIDIVQLGCKQAADVFRIAGRSREFELADHPLAIPPPHAEFEPPRPLAPAFEFAGHVGGKIGHDLIEQVAVADRFHQPALHQRHVLRNDRQQGFGYMAEQLVHADQRVRGRRLAIAEPALDGIAPDGRKLAQAFEAKALEHGQHVRIEPQCCDRQAGQGGRRIVFRAEDGIAGAEMCHRPCCPRSWCDRGSAG